MWASNAARSSTSTTWSGLHLEVDRGRFTRPFPPTWTHLVAKNDGRDLVVDISRNEPVKVFGAGPTIQAHDEEVTPPAGKAILSLYLEQSWQTRKR